MVRLHVHHKGPYDAPTILSCIISKHTVQVLKFKTFGSKKAISQKSNHYLTKNYRDPSKSKQIKEVQKNHWKDHTLATKNWNTKTSEWKTTKALKRAIQSKSE